MEVSDSRAIVDPEVAGLVDELDRAFGLDVRGWSASALQARIAARARAEGLRPAELRVRILDDRRCLARLLTDLSARAGGPFGDVAFVRALRTDVIPRLKTYPSIRVWHAGCSTGEEVYATAIVFREEGLMPRTVIYATESSEVVLERARSGVVDADPAQVASRYQASGGAATLAEYYRHEPRRLVAESSLREHVVFAEHSFATDASFNEFHLIVCRGVLTLFGAALRDRAQRILFESVCRFGYLALGAGEPLLDPYRRGFEPVSPRGADPSEAPLSRTDLYRRIA